MSSSSKPKALVALSGGVDSSVAAHLVRQRGYDIIGATLLLDPTQGERDDSSCGGSDAIDSAASVARSLGIPHVVIDGRKEFQEQVLRPAWRSYASGMTPSPCILCNQRIKLGLLMRHAMELGCDAVATGHYARIVATEDGVRRVARGLDASKDQAYFLFALGQEQLSRMILPLGELTKVQVRSLAESLNLSTAHRKDSQDACFALSGEGFSESLRLKFNEESPSGPVIDEDGKVLGRHHGIHRFTIGQRRGFGFRVGHKAFVREIRPEDGAILLTSREEDLLSRQMSLSLENLNVPESTFRCQIQIRSRHRAAWGEVRVQRDDQGKATSADIIFDDPQRAITPGQAGVLFRGEEVLGGGWIVPTRR